MNGKKILEKIWKKTSGRLFRKKIPEKNFRPELIFIKNFTEKKKIRKKSGRKFRKKFRPELILSNGPIREEFN